MTWLLTKEKVIAAIGHLYLFFFVQILLSFSAREIVTHTIYHLASSTLAIYLFCLVVVDVVGRRSNARLVKPTNRQP